jgi:hypothetical protein
MACGTHKGVKIWVVGFGGKPEGKRALGRTGGRWDDNIKTDIKGIG